jgi:hypothetical protein
MNGGHNRGQRREDADEISSTHPTTVPSSSPLIVHILGSGEGRHQIPFQSDVTTQGWPRRSPAYSVHVLKSQPKEAHGPHYIAAPMRSYQHQRIFRIKSGFIPFLRRSSRRTISASRRPSSRRRHPVRELTSRWWLTGGYGPLQIAGGRG